MRPELRRQVRRGQHRPVSRRCVPRAMLLQHLQRRPRRRHTAIWFACAHARRVRYTSLPTCKIRRRPRVSGDPNPRATANARHSCLVVPMGRDRHATMI